MDRPANNLVDLKRNVAMEIEYPGGVGEVLHDPDGGAWVRGKLRMSG